MPMSIFWLLEDIVIINGQEQKSLSLKSKSNRWLVGGGGLADIKNQTVNRLILKEWPTN